jgi:hypothetical protein
MTEEPFRISMKIREQGPVPFTCFDPQGPAWVISVIVWKSAAAE